MARRHPCAEARANEADGHSKAKENSSVSRPPRVTVPKRPRTCTVLVLGRIEKSFLREIVEPREVRGPCSIGRGKPQALHPRRLRSFGELAEPRADLAPVEGDPVGLRARARAAQERSGLGGDPCATFRRLTIDFEPRLFSHEQNTKRDHVLARTF